MSFTIADRQSALWLKLRPKIAAEITALRDRLEKAKDAAAIARAQGQIAALRDILKMVDPPEEEPKPDQMTSGPTY